MRSKKIFTATLAAVMALTMAIPTQASAKEQQSPISADRSQIVATMDLDNGIGDFSLKDVSGVPLSDTVNPEEVINVSEGADAIQPRIGTPTKYGWGSRTAPYTFTQTWSTDQEVYSTYPWYDDGLFFPAATGNLNAPSSSQYQTEVREGYVNDTWATDISVVGAHVYYHTVTANEQLNSVTVLLDQNIAFQVYDMNLDPVLSMDSPAYSNLLFYNYVTVNHNNATKVVHTFKLAAGNYLIMFWDNGNEKGNYHYAMFTGNPLPIEQSYLAGSAFTGSVGWDGHSSSQTYDGASVTISVNGGAELFALYRVTFQDTGSSYFNTYINSVQMMYQSPNSYSYKTIANMANLRQDMIDNFPDEGSIVGTYRTRVTVNWRTGLSYVNASYSTNALLYIDYLVPLGEVNASF